MTEPLVRVSNLVKHFSINKGTIIARQVGAIKAVDGISFSIDEGDTLSLIGESGCGKSTTAKLLLLLERPTSGEMIFSGRDISHFSYKRIDWYRSQTQAVFQDPYSSLNPRMRVNEIISEPLKAHKRLPRGEMKSRITEVLNIVGLPSRAMDMFPHEFSGGQRQRLAIARALAPNPKFMILDEPVSALDVSIRAQIINLLKDIQARFKLTYLLIAHDLALVEHVSTVSAVMYVGKIVEMALSEDLFSKPLHPYTKALIAASPRPDPRKRGTGNILYGEVPSPINPPEGCRFHPRCVNAIKICREREPILHEENNGHYVACHLDFK